MHVDEVHPRAGGMVMLTGPVYYSSFRLDKKLGDAAGGFFKQLTDLPHT